MPSLKNVQSKTATTILYLKCESMERISGFLSYRKNQTRVALNKVFIMLNELRTKPLPFYDRVLYDKIITELKKYIPIDDNGNILTEVSFSANSVIFCGISVIYPSFKSPVFSQFIFPFK